MAIILYKLSIKPNYPKVEPHPSPSPLDKVCNQKHCVYFVITTLTFFTLLACHLF